MNCQKVLIMVIAEGNGYGELSSNLGGNFTFHIVPIHLGKVYIQLFKYRKRLFALPMPLIS